MRKLRLLLLPFGTIYGLLTGLRNWLYAQKILKSKNVPVPSISIGNLSTGGTGKTPLVDYLVRHFMDQNKKVATLSRGYGRSSSGARIAALKDGPNEIGDEPTMYLSRHNDLLVAVAEDRNTGVDLLLREHKDISIILLDDAFQHRAIVPGLSLLVTEYQRPFFSDFMLPAGNLREPRKGRLRADAVVVSKCPKLTREDKIEFIANLKIGQKPVFFSHISYDNLVGFTKTAPSDSVKNILLVTGIGNPTPLLEHLEKSYFVMHIRFRDHHAYTTEDIQRIHEKFDNFASLDKIIVTTEKDAMRIRGIHDLSKYADYWFFQPIQIQIDEEHEFIRLLDEYADKI